MEINGTMVPPLASGEIQPSQPTVTFAHFGPIGKMPGVSELGHHSPCQRVQRRL
jgi:hypothetical protein